MQFHIHDMDKDILERKNSYQINNVWFKKKEDAFNHLDVLQITTRIQID